MKIIFNVYYSAVRYNKNETLEDIKNVLYEFKNKDHKK
jgi:hypothetical protein